MKNLMIITCLFVFVLATSLLVRADIARPKQSASPVPPNKTIYSSFQIVPDPKGVGALLTIRQSVFNQLIADNQRNNSNNLIASTAGQSSTRTIVSGVLLFLSISLGGVWIARTMRIKSGAGRGQKAVVAGLIAVATIGAAAIITQGNAAPPISSWRGLPTNLTEGRATSGELRIEIIPDDSIEGPGANLYVPIQKQNRKGDEE